VRSIASVKALRIAASSARASAAPALAILLISFLSAGCQGNRFVDPSQASSTPLAEVHPTGIVMGGQQPVTGNLIQLYAVGTAGDSSAATTLIHTTLTTSDGSGLPNSNANAGNTGNSLPAGSFSITGDFTCPSASSEVYLVGTGGNPGLAPGANNPNLSLMAALGPCGGLSASTYLVMNELTTVAAVASLSNFMSSYATLGSGAGDAAQLQTAFLAANEYANVSYGTSPGPVLPVGASVPSTSIQTLGDIAATCINSAGGVAGDNSACGQLFTLATISGSPAPTDTIGAMVNILKQPTVNASNIFNLAQASTAFEPTLSTPPASWVLPVTTQYTYTLYAFPESDNSVTPLYNFINSAQHTIDMTMYEMQDTTFTADLVAACNRGVRVRVIFSSSIASSSSTAYSALNSAGANCSAVDSNSHFVNTHQKTITIDGAFPSAQTAIMSLNLQTQYYSTTRDFALIENDPVDIAAIEATFNQDYAAGGTNSLTEYNYQPGAGDDLIWSPTTATTDMQAIINNAKSTLLVENEEMSASNIVSALVAACTRGVTVHIAMEYSSSYVSNFNSLKTAGCKLSTYNNPNGFYIHAKAVVADYGLPTQSVYMGSINYSTASLTENRELGVYIVDPASVQLLNSTIASDYAGGTAY
jgi:phosphatidylserine/phosphatidylglycerophosphate/cardiolipin synthase-like enzyme